MAIRRPLTLGNSGGLREISTADTLDDSVLSANLAAFGGLVGAANKLPYFTGAGALALSDYTVFGRSLVATADAPAARGVLGLGTAVTRDATSSPTDTTSERLWRTNDLVKQTAVDDATPGRMLSNGSWGVGGTPVGTGSDDPDGFRFGSGFYNNGGLATSVMGAYSYIMTMSNTAGSAAVQLGLSITQNTLKYRRYTGGAWSSVRTVWDDGNLVKQASTNDATAGAMVVNGGWGWGGLTPANIGNMNTFNLPTSVYRYQNTVDSGTTPNAGQWNGVVLQLDFSPTISRQLALSVTGAAADQPQLYTRHLNSSVISAWHQIWTSADFQHTAKANLTSPTFTGVATFDTIKPNNQITYEADNYGAGWARGLYYLDGAVIQAGFVALGAAGTVSSIHMGWGNSPHTATNRVTVSAAGVDLIGTVTAPTAAAGDSTTKVATTAHVQAITGGVRFKTLATTTSSMQNDSVNIDHGLNAQKIVSVSAIVEANSSTFVIPGYTMYGGYEFQILTGSTFIQIINMPAKSYNILSKPVRILIAYTL